MKAIKNLLVSIPTAFQEEIIMGSGIKLYFDPSYNPENNVTVSGTAEEVPLHLANKIKKGDTIFFSFKVVSDRKAITEDEIYEKVTAEESKYFERYISNKGNTVTLVGMMGKISVEWTGTYVTKYGFQHGVQGTRSQAERWLSRFNFNSDCKYQYKNLFEIEDNDYWKVAPHEVFAKIEGENLIPVGDRIILEPIELELSKEEVMQNGIVLPQNTKEIKIRLGDKGRITHDFLPLELKKGDVVGFEPKFVEKYEISGKQYFLLKPKRANTKWQTED